MQIMSQILFAIEESEQPNWFTTIGFILFVCFFLSVFCLLIVNYYKLESKFNSQETILEQLNSDLTRVKASYLHLIAQRRDINTHNSDLIDTEPLTWKRLQHRHINLARGFIELKRAVRQHRESAGKYSCLQRDNELYNKLPERLTVKTNRSDIDSADVYLSKCIADWRLLSSDGVEAVIETCNVCGSLYENGDY